MIHGVTMGLLDIFKGKPETEGQFRKRVRDETLGQDLTEMLGDNLIVTYEEEGSVPSSETAKQKRRNAIMIAEMRRRGYKGIDELVKESTAEGKSRRMAKLKKVV